MTGKFEGHGRCRDAGSGPGVPEEEAQWVNQFQPSDLDGLDLSDRKESVHLNTKVRRLLPGNL